jgi:hypothetical protein
VSGVSWGGSSRGVVVALGSLPAAAYGMEGERCGGCSSSSGSSSSDYSLTVEDRREEGFVTAETAQTAAGAAAAAAAGALRPVADSAWSQLGRLHLWGGSSNSGSGSGSDSSAVGSSSHGTSNNIAVPEPGLLKLQQSSKLTMSPTAQSGNYTQTVTLKTP